MLTTKEVSLAVELSGVPDAICGLQEGAQNTMTTTDVALLMHMQ